MPLASGPVTAIVVSGGKQYRVSPGDQVLVDRITADPGSELTLDRVLLVAQGGSVRVGAELAGETVTARVVRHQRGPKIDVLRYKSKKKVRVHRGARADLTAIQILSVGAAPARPAAKATAEPGVEAEPAPAAAAEAKPRRAPRTKPAATESAAGETE